MTELQFLDTDNAQHLIPAGLFEFAESRNTRLAIAYQSADRYIPAYFRMPGGATGSPNVRSFAVQSPKARSSLAPLLNNWLAQTGDNNAEAELLAALKVGLDAARSSSRKLFP